MGKKPRQSESKYKSRLDWLVRVFAMYDDSYLVERLRVGVG